MKCNALGTHKCTPGQGVTKQEVTVSPCPVTPCPMLGEWKKVETTKKCLKLHAQ